MNTYDQHIEKWYILKQEISELERKLNRHKNKIKSYMKSNSINTLTNSSNTIIVDSRSVNSSRISRESIPRDLWNQYSKQSSYDVYTVRRIGDKRSRSRPTSRSTSRSTSQPTSRPTSRPTSPYKSNQAVYENFN